MEGVQGARLVTGAFAVVAENSILDIVHFAAAMVWQRGVCGQILGLRWISRKIKI